MVYDERLAARVRESLGAHRGVAEKPMFGGLCFLLNGHMAAGIVGSRLMLRVGPDDYSAALRALTRRRWISREGPSGEWHPCRCSGDRRPEGSGPLVGSSGQVRSKTSPEKRRSKSSEFSAEPVIPPVGADTCRYTKRLASFRVFLRPGGGSSAGRAPGLQPGGRRFDPGPLHSPTLVAPLPLLPLRSGGGVLLVGGRSRSSAVTVYVALPSAPSSIRSLRVR